MITKETFLNSLKIRWYLYLLAFLAIGTIILRIITPSLQPRNPLTEWQGLSPGRSTADDVHTRLGAPLETYDVDGGRLELYSGESPLLPNETYTKDGILQRIIIRDMKKVPEETMRFVQSPTSSPNLLRYAEGYEEGYTLFVYSTKGVAVIKHNLGDIVQVWQFAPMSADEFVRTVGKDTKEQSGPDHPFLDDSVSTPSPEQDP